ncbi:hypothetical protein BY458DRAFT_524303 [Sporodiniella umbellata]|nr:hypothetical protein BY458DRAFT_524303 [Sporodiniella umbellata]
MSLLGVGLVILGLIFLKTLRQQSAPLLPYNPLSPPTRNINFTLPGQKDVFYIDLDKYPIEDHLVELFAGSKEALRSSLVEKLASTTDRSKKHTSWACQDQLPPLPILRKMIRDSLAVKDATHYFDQPHPFNLSAPFAFFPFDSMPELKAGQAICLRIWVPFSNRGKLDPYRLAYHPFKRSHEAIRTPWWDTFMSTIRNTQTDEIDPLQMSPWSGHAILRQKARTLRPYEAPPWVQLRDDRLAEREQGHLYETEWVVPQRGEFEWTALLEFVEGRYYFEEGPVTSYEPVQLPVWPQSRISLPKASPDPAQLLQQHLALPLCETADSPGRWLPLPTNSTGLLAVSRHGKYWAPYTCRYRQITYEQFNRCISTRYPQGIDIYGDSNMRRSIKKFVSHGQWCKDWEKHLENPLVPEEKKPTLASKRQSYASPQEYRFLVPEQTRSCYCEDFWEPHWNTEWFSPGARRSYLEIENTPAQSAKVDTSWGKSRHDKFKISSYKWDGLTHLNEPGWEVAVDENREISDLAIFSLGNWDSAFSTLDLYLERVHRLLDQIETHYQPNKTLIIYRTSQYFCCRLDYDHRQRQLSGPQHALFESIVRQLFVDRFQAHVWDIQLLGQTMTWDEKLESIDCSSNHVPADLVEIENQILMNSLCNPPL